MENYYITEMISYKDSLYVARSDGTLWEYWEDDSGQNWRQIKLPPQMIDK